jgi:YesN/AraC family two-component response regulator
MKAQLLIVDDEQEIREALARHFRFLGYNVSTASNGQEALEKLNEMKVDVLISDIVMPVMTGVELLRVIRKEFPMVRTIMITGYVTQENVMACMRHGAETCIFKPWTDMQELEKAVTDAVEKNAAWKRKMKQLIDMKPSLNA